MSDYHFFATRPMLELWRRSDPAFVEAEKQALLKGRMTVYGGVTIHEIRSVPPPPRSRLSIETPYYHRFRQRR